MKVPRGQVKHIPILRKCPVIHVLQVEAEAQVVHRVGHSKVNKKFHILNYFDM